MKNTQQQKSVPTRGTQTHQHEAEGRRLFLSTAPKPGSFCTWDKALKSLGPTPEGPARAAETWRRCWLPAPSGSVHWAVSSSCCACFAAHGFFL